ncbi:putative squalene monooxygenase [Helianthus debilis subsp. tardiflorus]
MRQACFDYLSLKGICSQGSISLLSRLNRSLIVLFLHFFSIAIFGVGCFSQPIPITKTGASGIIFPIIKSEGVRQMYFPAMVVAYYKAPQVA